MPVVQSDTSCKLCVQCVVIKWSTKGEMSTFSLEISEKKKNG